MSYKDLKVGQRLWTYFKFEWLPVRVIKNDPNSAHNIRAIVISKNEIRKIAFDERTNIVANCFYTRETLKLLGFININGVYIVPDRKHIRTYKLQPGMGFGTFDFLIFELNLVGITYSKDTLDIAFLTCIRDVHSDDISMSYDVRKDKKDLVLISLDEYNALKETSYLLSGKNGNVLLSSIQEAKPGTIINPD